ncbi:MAG: response regulator [Chloroflexota bacterium]|nr:MAG: response regulator [Chloroflexota bacterium]
MRIVIATGDTDLRLAIQLMLSEEPGISIIGSVSDCDGLNALVKSTRPNYALIDWALPGCKIDEVIENLKTGSRDTELKIIVIARQRREKEAALESGADEFIVIGDPPEKLLDVFRLLNVE